MWKQSQEIAPCKYLLNAERHGGISYLK